jgi:tetratricopeptide (TPR) repeat protein
MSRADSPSQAIAQAIAQVMRRGIVAFAVGMLGLFAGCAMFAKPAAPPPAAVAAVSAPAPAASAPDIARIVAALPEPEPRAAPAQASPGAEPQQPPPAPPLPPLPAAVQQAFAAAVTLQRAGRADEAASAWKALLREQPELAGAHANLGLLHRKAGRLDEAIVALERAVQLSPLQAAFSNQLGIALRQAGRFAQARQAYERGLAAQPEHAASHFNLAILLDLYLGDRDAALAHYQRAQVLLPEQAPQVQRWVAELKNRKPDAPLALRKEKE